MLVQEWAEEVREGQEEVRVGSFWMRRRCKTLVVVSETSEGPDELYGLIALSDPDGYGIIGTFYSEPVPNLSDLKLNEFDRIYPPFLVPVFGWRDEQ